MFFYFGFEPDRSEAAACRYLNANAVSEDDCRGDAIQRQNATTPNRATVPGHAAGHDQLPTAGLAARAAAGSFGSYGRHTRQERSAPRRAERGPTTTQ